MEGLRIGCHSNSYACEGRGANAFGNILQLLVFVNSGFLLLLDCIIAILLTVVRTDIPGVCGGSFGLINITTGLTSTLQGVL